jgi:hypothetical protein
VNFPVPWAGKGTTTILTHRAVLGLFAFAYALFTDITINSDIELYHQGQKLIVSVYYYEKKPSIIINQNTDYYKSTDNGNSWITIDTENEPVQLSGYTLLYTLYL